jgi:hypothetical protein
LSSNKQTFTKLSKYPDQVQLKAEAHLDWSPVMCLGYDATKDDVPVKPVTLNFKDLHPQFENLFWKFGSA